MNELANQFEDALSDYLNAIEKSASGAERSHLEDLMWDNKAAIGEALKKIKMLRQALEQQRYENVKIEDCAKRYAAQLASARKALKEILEEVGTSTRANKIASAALTDENSK